MMRRLSFIAALGLTALALAGCKKPANSQDTLLQEAREAGDDLSALQAPPTSQLRVDPNDAPMVRSPAPAATAAIPP